MTDDIQKLINSLRLGEHEDPTERISLLIAALVEQKAGPDLILSLLRAPQVPLRLAALEASRGCVEPGILAEFTVLADSAEAVVRKKLAEILGNRSDSASIDLLRKLAADSETSVRIAVMRSTSGWSEFRAIHENALAHDEDSDVRFAAVAALEAQSSREVVRAFAASLLREDDWSLWRRCAEILERRLEKAPSETESELPTDIAVLTRIQEQLKQHGVQRFPKFVSWLGSQTASRVDPEALARFGTDLTSLAQRGTLSRAHFVDEACETILKLLRQTPTRSVALLGAAGVGKSSLVHELVYRLAEANDGWRVLRVSPTDFMSGTKYLGEWESKVRDLIEAIRMPRRVLLYIPSLSELSAAGTWSKSDNNVATALAPYIDDGSLVVIGESTPEEFERGLGKMASLRRLFDRVLLLEPDLDRTRSILTMIRDEARSGISNGLLDQLLEVSAQFLSHISRPGNAVELLRTAIKEEKSSGRVLTFRDLLDFLTRSIGIPADLLDDSVPLQQEATKAFFESRIIGQAKAVDAVVDLVTLIKAGLTDPNRPFGVFMFVGPTGVGKTELARALAEFIFGDASRLKRFDMSEFANQEGFTRLIGTQFENGLLTDAVRQHPFSVVLLDEIEKAHINVFDLCLQIFDAGRLTDGRGRTVDFRRTIIVLTSNVGATTGLLGFGAADSESGQKPAKENMPRELSRFFRPEFLNRLDRILQFEPLSLEVAEQIARKEIQSVLQRSGIRRRQLIVDLDANVVSLIVKEGYSQKFGARPLKRTVERRILLPLAKAISSGALQEKSIVRLSLQSGRLKVTTTVPRVDITGTPKAEVKAAASLAALHERYNGLDGSIKVMMTRKTGLIEQTHEPAFAKDRDLRASVLNDIHNIDQFLSLCDATGTALRDLHHRARDLAIQGDAALQEQLSRLEQEVHHISFVAKCGDARDLGDALLAISLVSRSGETQDAVQKIASMYQGLATRRRLTAEVVGELFLADQDRVYIVIAGLGAYGLLKREVGLHQVVRRYKQRAARSNRELLREDRELLRVEVSPAPHDPSPQFQRQVKTRVSSLKPIRNRLIKAEFALNLFHEPSLRSVEVWTGGPKEKAIARGLLILSASGESNLDGSDTNGIVRQYDLGLAPKVKDLRTGRVTTRVNQVLRGELATLLD